MAAFVGNLLYSLSILLSPLAQTDECTSVFIQVRSSHSARMAAFLAESVPYLIGSGGTLCFDLSA